jgi:hypothetical protein
MVKSSFVNNSSLTNSQEIEVAKAAAVRGLANYMLLESGGKDAGMSKAMRRQVDDIAFDDDEAVR